MEQQQQLLSSNPSVTNIRAMQLFYELKRLYPAVPDSVVSNCLKEVDYERDKAVDLLAQEAPKYSRPSLPLKKAPPTSLSGWGPQSSSKSSPSTSSPMDGRGSSAPPPLPNTPPVASAVPSGLVTPPSYASPLYRPDIDLSLPPPPSSSQRSASVNVVLHPQEMAGRVLPGSSHVRSQLQITITTPPGHPGVPSSLPHWYGPAASSPVTEQRVKSQCAALESLRRSLEESRKQQTALRRRVEQLQEELTKEKQLLTNDSNQSGQPSAVVDLARLRQEVESLQLECQRMYQELDERSSTSETQPTRIARQNGVVAAEEETAGWNCGVCTFINHPALDKCEECFWPRPIPPANGNNNINNNNNNLPPPVQQRQSPARSSSTSPSNQAHGDGRPVAIRGSLLFQSSSGGRQQHWEEPCPRGGRNIHIHVRHHRNDDD